MEEGNGCFCGLVTLQVPGCVWCQHHGEVSSGFSETFLEAGRALPSSTGSQCLNRGAVQFVIPPRHSINIIYIMNCGPWAIRIGFGTQNNPEELMTPEKGFQVCWMVIRTSWAEVVFTQ